ncbi:MAG: protein kinase domain-containing protein [Solirubrobacteraceae bacterium]
MEQLIMRPSELSTVGHDDRTPDDPTRRQGAVIPGEPALVLDRYRLSRRLGAGGFGIVWWARDEHLERDVAVKIVPREKIVDDRFEREARAAARLTHPAIVTLYEAAIDEHGAYLVSELVVGATLDQLLAAGRLSDREIVAIGVTLCHALAHAHWRGIVHRDVKPSNILVPERPCSSAQIAKLTDFGVARVLDGDVPGGPSGDPVTRAGDVIGTAAYMAPEQAAGREVGAAADLFSLAVVIYEGLSGVNPLGTGRATNPARALGAQLVPLRRQRRGLPLGLTEGIDLALAPQPRERGSLDQLRETMAAALGQLDDTPGVVTSAWRARGADRARREDGASRQADRFPGHDDRRAERLAPHDLDRQAHPAWLARGFSGVAAGALSAWLASHVLTGATHISAVAGLLGALLVLAMARTGWLVIIAGFALATTLQHHPGAALVIVIGGTVPIALAPLAPRIWPLGVGGPALGVLGLACAWPAVAGRAPRAARRGALGCIGWVWLALASALSGTDLYLRTASIRPAPDAWTASLHQTIVHVLVPLVSARTLAPAAVWALAAVVLPWLIRRRSLRIDALRVVVWAGALVYATGAVGEASHGSPVAPTLGAVLAGAGGGVVVALLPSLRGLWRTRRTVRGPAAGVA